MTQHHNGLDGQFALILGASSGFGGAVALELARQGMHIFGAHLDRRATLPNVEQIVGEIRSLGREAHFFNVNAADAEKRGGVVAAIKERVTADPSGPQTVKVLLHSLAFGTLRPYLSEDPKERLTQAQMEMTLDVMANSLVYWTQDLHFAGLLGEGSRIYAMTSAGSTRVVPTYGAVSAAKAALESHIRQLAMELGPHGRDRERHPRRCDRYSRAATHPRPREPYQQGRAGQPQRPHDHARGHCAGNCGAGYRWHTLAYRQRAGRGRRGRHRKLVAAAL